MLFEISWFLFLLLRRHFRNFPNKKSSAKKFSNLGKPDSLSMWDGVLEGIINIGVAHGQATQLPNRESLKSDIGSQEVKILSEWNWSHQRSFNSGVTQHKKKKFQCFDKECHTVTYQRDFFLTVIHRCKIRISNFRLNHTLTSRNLLLIFLGYVKDVES